MNDKIKIGISSCLLGEGVRFDGGHKHDKYLTEKLGAFFSYQPFCPEVAIGLGVPRASLRLIQDEHKQVRAVMPKTGEDYTAPLDEYAQKVAPKLHALSGYIFKRKSPSCGMERVKVYNTDGMPLIGDGVGIYAKRLQALLPNLPVEEEGRLHDPLLREHFIKRVFAYHDWQQTRVNITVGQFVAFHSRHKYLLILHHYGQSKTLGRMVANANDQNVAEIANSYEELFMQTLKNLPKRRHHAQVLTRIVGTINKQLDTAQKQDILKLIEEYETGQLPLSAPVRLIKHYLTKVDEPYIAQQSYLNPYPDNLGLMNHA